MNDIVELPPYKLPETFRPSRRAPTMKELEWLNETLFDMTDDNAVNLVLEFGAGVTSHCVDDALMPDVYVAVEGWAPMAEAVEIHVPNIRIITAPQTWNDIPKINYNWMLVDGSSLPPPDLKPMNDFIFRHDAVRFAEQFIAKDCIIILHDWNYREGWRLPRKYLEANGYKLLASLETKYGWGIFQK